MQKSIGNAQKKWTMAVKKLDVKRAMTMDWPVGGLKDTTGVLILLLLLLLIRQTADSVKALLNPVERGCW